MYTRKLLSLKFNLSLATIRRLLLLLSILPVITLLNKNGLPLYYYSLLSVDLLKKHLILAALYKKTKKKTCSICHKKYTLLYMCGTRCIDCYIDKCCKPIIFGKEPWKKLVNNKFIEKAIEMLKSATKINL